VKKFGMAVATAAVLVLVMEVVLGALVLRGGISAKIEPTRVEAAIARKLRSMAIPDDFRHLGNPVAPSKDVVAAGLSHFADHCAICHANDGSGQTEMGRNLYPRVPDLRLATTQGLTDGELFYIIENGVRLTGMPGFGDGSEERKRGSWHLVAFIRRLPQLSPDEKLKMERLNPKSPDEWREMEQDEEFLKDDETSSRPQKDSPQKQSHHH
jgi:mono/diheme cytochrome c family protein